MKQVSILMLALTDKAQLVGLALGKKEFRHLLWERIPEWLRLKGISEAPLAQAHAQEGSPNIAGCLGLVSRWLLNISKDGESTICLHNPGQCSAALKCKKNVSLMIRQSLLCCSWCPLPLVLSPGTTEKSLALFSLYPPSR